MINKRNIKIQQEILKSLLKEEKIFYYVTDEQKLIVTNNGYVAYVMPEEDFKVSLNDNQRSSSFKCFMAEYKESTVLRKTANIIEKGKDTYQEFVNEYFSVYVDRKLFKLFGQGEFVYKGSSSKSAVFIEENGELIGFVMPVNPKIFERGE